MGEDDFTWKRKRGFCIPIRQVSYSNEYVEAINLAEAIKMFEENDDKNYGQFDDCRPQIELDEDTKIIKEYREDLKNRGVLPIE